MKTNRLNTPWALGLETDGETAQIIGKDGFHIATVSQYPHIGTANLMIQASNLLKQLRIAERWMVAALANEPEDWDNGELKKDLAAVRKAIRLAAKRA